VPIAIVGEAFFADETTHDLRFDDFAAADADRDGRISGEELSTAMTCLCAYPTDSRMRRLLDAVRSRGENMFVLRAE
jgi:Ca2+-binding EF-hand superfamily protein